MEEETLSQHEEQMESDLEDFECDEEFEVKKIKIGILFKLFIPYLCEMTEDVKNRNYLESFLTFLNT